ncbi:hypothetical protein GXP67_18170 [Rhodocytophaga rosea]|uniref:Lipoprotein n=1 Tax=Rhodocytophaga rosea TaxID=2704465 RepID=A0A6C0GLB0_9BACT|nr:hypothetical protein [Rhodocytophaga rosea]QHT68430.1 hypothetical protein GXP67_18170 [Rhodocytophaga rosea]
MVNKNCNRDLGTLIILATSIFLISGCSPFRKERFTISPSFANAIKTDGCYIISNEASSDSSKNSDYCPVFFFENGSVACLPCFKESKMTTQEIIVGFTEQQLYSKEGIVIWGLYNISNDSIQLEFNHTLSSGGFPAYRRITKWQGIIKNDSSIQIFPGPVNEKKNLPRQWIFPAKGCLLKFQQMSDKKLLDSTKAWIMKENN